jgi:hypothetical protein
MVGTARTIDLAETEEEGLASFFSFLLLVLLCV